MRSSSRSTLKRGAQTGKIAEISKVSPATASRKRPIFVKVAMIEATPP